MRWEKVCVYSDQQRRTDSNLGLFIIIWWEQRWCNRPSDLSLASAIPSGRQHSQMARSYYWKSSWVLMTRLIFSSLWWNEIKLKERQKLRAIKLPSGILVRQTITVSTKTYRHILICSQAICCGIMPENSTKDILINVLFLIRNVILLSAIQPLCPTDQWLQSWLVMVLFNLLLFTEWLWNCHETYVFQTLDDFVCKMPDVFFRQYKFVNSRNGSCNNPCGVGTTSAVLPVFQGFALELPLGVKECDIIELSVPVCYFLCFHFR